MQKHAYGIGNKQTSTVDEKFPVCFRATPVAGKSHFSFNGMCWDMLYDFWILSMLFRRKKIHGLAHQTMYRSNMEKGIEWGPLLEKLTIELQILSRKILVLKGLQIQDTCSQGFLFFLVYVNLPRFDYHFLLLWSIFSMLTPPTVGFFP